MKNYDVPCPICGTINRQLNLEETNGWMECEKCAQVVKVLSVPGMKRTTVPLYSPQQLADRFGAAH